MLFLLLKLLFLLSYANERQWGFLTATAKLAASDRSATESRRRRINHGRWQTPISGASSGMTRVDGLIWAVGRHDDVRVFLLFPMRGCRNFLRGDWEPPHSRECCMMACRMRRGTKYQIQTSIHPPTLCFVRSTVTIFSSVMISSSHLHSAGSVVRDARP